MLAFFCIFLHFFHSMAPSFLMFRLGCIAVHVKIFLYFRKMKNFLKFYRKTPEEIVRERTGKPKKEFCLTIISLDLYFAEKNKNSVFRKFLKSVLRMSAFYFLQKYLHLRVTSEFMRLFQFLPLSVHNSRYYMRD